MRLQDKLGKQNFHGGMKKVFEPMTDIVKDVSEVIRKTRTESSINNNIALEILNEKFSELMNDKAMMAPC